MLNGSSSFVHSAAGQQQQQPTCGGSPGRITVPPTSVDDLTCVQFSEEIQNEANMYFQQVICFVFIFNETLRMPDEIMCLYRIPFAYAFLNCYFCITAVRFLHFFLLRKLLKGSVTNSSS